MAQFVRDPVLTYLRVAGHEVGAELLDHLAGGEEFGGEFAEGDDEGRGLGGRVQGDVGGFEEEGGDGGVGGGGVGGVGGKVWRRLVEEVVQTLLPAHAVAHQHQRHILCLIAARHARPHVLDIVVDVLEDLGCRACEALLSGFDDGTTPAALVEGVNGDGIWWRGEGREEVVVCIAVVGEAVDKYQVCGWW